MVDVSSSVILIDTADTSVGASRGTSLTRTMRKNAKVNKVLLFMNGKVWGFKTFVASWKDCSMLSKELFSHYSIHPFVKKCIKWVQSVCMCLSVCNLHSLVSQINCLMRNPGFCVRIDSGDISDESKNRVTRLKMSWHYSVHYSINNAGLDILKCIHFQIQSFSLLRGEWMPEE